MKLELKVINLLWQNKDKAFTINEISKTLKETYSNINKIAIRLIKENVLDKNIVGHAFQCSINKESDKARALVHLAEVEKKQEYLKKYEKISLLFNDLLKELSNNTCCIVLFGSYAKETFSKESDIDVLILLKRKEDLTAILRKINSMHGKELSPLIFTLDEFIKRKNEAVVKEIFSSHIIIKGFDVFIPEGFK